MIDNFKFFQENINWVEVNNNQLLNQIIEERRRIREDIQRNDVGRMRFIRGGASMFNNNPEQRLFTFNMENMTTNQLSEYIHDIRGRFENQTIPIIDHIGLIQP